MKDSETSEIIDFPLIGVVLFVALLSTMWQSGFFSVDHLAKWTVVATSKTYITHHSLHFFVKKQHQFACYCPLVTVIMY